MNDLKSIMTELESLGSAQTKKTHMNHGAPENKTFGVKVGDLKPIVKRIKKNYELAKALFDTGNSDAMYLAGLIADEKKMTKADLQEWAKNATWAYISEFAVPWVAAEGPCGWELALEWIQSDNEKIATTGWNTLVFHIGFHPDEQLDKKQVEKLLKQIEKDISKAENRVRYCMNGFIIAVGSYIPSLTDKAKQTASKIGKVSVDMNGTACKVPDAIAYIDKVESMGRVGQKRKNMRC